jgi:hypothetical protein
VKTKTKISIAVFIIHAVVISLFVLPGRPDGEGWAWIGPVAIDYPVVIFIYPLLENISPNSGAWLLYSSHIILGGLWWVFVVWFFSWRISFFRTFVRQKNPNKSLKSGTPESGAP